MFKMGQEIPEMTVRICPTLADAKSEATIAEHLAQQPYRRGAIGPLRHPKCHSLSVAVVPLAQEPSISAYVAWALVFNPRGPHRMKEYVLSGEVPVSVAKTPIRFYVARFRDETKQWYQGWVELPDEPYILKYLEYRQRAR
jgi:hypothetical protein